MLSVMVCISLKFSLALINIGRISAIILKALKLKKTIFYQGYLGRFVYLGLLLLNEIVVYRTIYKLPEFEVPKLSSRVADRSCGSHHVLSFFDQSS